MSGWVYTNLQGGPISECASHEALHILLCLGGCILTYRVGLLLILAPIEHGNTNYPARSLNKHFIGFSKWISKRLLS